VRTQRERSVEELTPYVRDGRAFVAVDKTDAPVAYILLDAADCAAHIEQVSVHLAYARQGIGRRTLIDRADTWARGHGLRALTLTTYGTCLGTVRTTSGSVSAT